MIKNIIFDVGDVLLEYRWKDMLMEHGLEEAEAEKMGALMFDNELWKILDLGVKTEDEVIAAYAEQYPEYGDTIHWFLKHGERMHINRTDVWEKVHILKEKGYHIYLLSNYSEKLFNRHTKGAAFLDDIDGMVVSYQIHISKPDERIYRYILEKYALKAEECIFFDDRAENTAAAEKVGIKATTITSRQQLLTILTDIIETINDRSDAWRNRVKQINDALFDFIEQSPSCFHVVENLSNEMKQAGYERILEEDIWNISLGKKYFATRNHSSLIAITMPDKAPKGIHIVASHSDSPTFRVKASPEITVEEQYVKLNTEKYGGMILSSWLDRPLSVAGRVVVETDAGLEEKLVCLDKDLLVIPNVAIHMNRDMNASTAYNPQVDMLPLYSDIEGKGTFQKQIAACAGVNEEQIAGSDLYLYARGRGKTLGEQENFIMSPKLDDLQCAFAAKEAFLGAESENFINVYAIFDNEEVGSRTKQGADSTFLTDVLLRVTEGLGMSQSEYRRLLANSFCISADNAHAVHPNHPEMADPTNRPYLNGGIVIKYHGGQKYTTDAVSEAYVKKLCKQAKVPFQTYANRSDIAGGSTLGNISNAHVSVNTVDIGLPQLAMHAAWETAGAKDTAYMIDMLKQFFQE